jgi:Xaa-Pro aminopeptidase
MTNRISSQEFQQRVQNIRKQMKKRNFEVLFIYSQRRGHVTYVSGYRPNYHTNSAVVVLPLERDPIMWVKFPFDVSRARTMSWFDDIRGSISEDSLKMFSECGEAIRSLGLGRSRIGCVASDLAVDEMGVSLSEALRAQLPSAQLEPASDLLNELRLVKSQNEIAILREATHLAGRVAESLGKEIKPGQTERLAAVRAAQTARFERGECDIIISSDSSRMAFPPSDHEFQRGRVVNCEITVQLEGYWVQICRVFSIGTPAAGQREVFEVARSAYEAAVQMARPGTSVACLADAVHKVIAPCYKNCIQYGTGHGVGLDLPELYPVEHECEGRLSPGMVLVIHPGIWVTDKGAAFVGGPMAVTEDGPSRLDTTSQTEITEV